LIFEFIDSCNEYVQKNELWKSGDRKKLFELVDSIKVIAILLFPFIPSTSEKIANQFVFKIDWKEISKPLKTRKIIKSEILFKKIEEKVNKPEKIEGVMTTGTINFQDWEKLDLRVAKINKVEDIEGADKLYKLTIDVGELGERIICAGIKKYYKKEQLKNKKIIIVANLEPRTLKGIESKGMLLAAGSKEKDKCVLLTPDSDIEEGSRVS